MIGINPNDTFVVIDSRLHTSLSFNSKGHIKANKPRARMPQHKLPNKHGGQRLNSGRRKNSEALGPPVRFRGLHQFGFTRNDIAAESTGIVGTPLEAMAVADGANIGPPNMFQS
jgi:hypothetical protein